MKILAVSDSHQDIRSLNEAIESEDHTDLLLHAGDYAKDIRMARTEKMDCRCVKGNCDGSFSCDPDELIIEIGLTKILLTHGHRFGVKYSLDALTEYGLEKGVHAVVFGHTHRQYLENRNGILLINPGSVSKQKSPSAGYALIITDGDGDLIGIELKRL